MIELNAYFHVPPASNQLAATGAVASLRPIADFLGQRDPLLKEWYLTGDSLEDSLRYKAFSEDFDGQQAAVAMIGGESKRNNEPPTVSVWNGQEASGQSANMLLLLSNSAAASSLNVKISSPLGTSRIGGYEEVAALLALAVVQYLPVFAAIYHPPAYKMVFPDRPGVGWMAFLPKIVTKKQVPAAGALIPVTQGSEQQGTIVVSATEEVFNEKNPEHVKVAHAVEIQLVEHDLLPTYQQLVKP